MPSGFKPAATNTPAADAAKNTLMGAGVFVVDAATLPWTGSQAGIGRQLPSVLKVAEQTLKIEHGSELRANALEPHQQCDRRARLCRPQHFIAFRFDFIDLS
jgi:hypothetical protein